ncbi:MAG: ATP-binding cassette domain-containing protein [Solirubrobacterales bacterium]
MEVGTSEGTPQAPAAAPAGPRAPGGPPAVAVRGLSKTFHVPPQRYTTLKERLVDRFRPEPAASLEALRDVSLAISRGEFVGIAGRNGSGKSSLLRCIAGIYDYDEGTVEVSGRLAPFVELGAGFTPDLSARENAALGAVMLGLSRAEARRRAERILAFAGLSDLAELELRNFSSGMNVRLAFSVAIQVDAEVLLIDEVLTAGDSSFKQRCHDELERLHSRGRTIVFVTHSMEDLQRYCTRALLLERGELLAAGPPERIAEQYEEVNARETERQRREAESPAAARLDREPAPAIQPEPATYRPTALGRSLRRLTELTASMAITEFRLKYHRSALGYLWSVMRPAIYFLVLLVIFTKVARLGASVSHYPAYLATAIVLWTFFTETVAGGVTSLSRNGPLLRKVRFPRLAIPLSLTVSSLINLAANSILVVVVLAVSGVEPRLSWLQMPALLALLALLALGTSMLFSALYVRYRDMQQVWQVLNQLLFFGSPIIYVARQYPDALEPLLSANPLAAILVQMRHALIDPSAPTAAEQLGGWPQLLIPLGTITAVLGLGFWLFTREAPRVAERT